MNKLHLSIVASVLLVSIFCLVFLPSASFAEDKNTLSNPIGVTSVSELIAKVIKAIMGFLGALATLMFIYGGFTLILSGGSAETIKKGQKTIVWAIIGVVVALSSYGIVEFVFQSFTA